MRTTPSSTPSASARTAAPDSAADSAADSADLTAAAPGAGWVRAIDHAELLARGRAVFRHDGRQIALLVTGDGRVYACDNRCPHEGYPLSEGSLNDGDGGGGDGDGCLLTCNWHNWKFDLRDGGNLYGGDRLRVYPVALRDGAVWLDLSEPPVARRRADALASLRAAFDDHDYTRLARELCRLALLQGDPLDALRQAIVWSHQRLEFGWTHAYAGAADWLTLYDRPSNGGHDGHDADLDEFRLACLLEAIGHIAYDVLREPDYPYPPQAADYAPDALLRAIEDQDEARAIALLRGALRCGLGFAELEPVLSRAALAHYADFGHSLIYVVKAGRLIGRLGPTVEQPLLLALVRSLVHAFREDLIPEFRGYRDALTRWPAATARAAGHGGDGAGENARAGGDADGRHRGPADPAGYRGLSVDKALAHTLTLAGQPAEAVYDTLLAANADHLLHYDIRYQQYHDRPVQDNVGWLDFTHALTFANAVRHTCRRHPDLWPAGLLQLACFSGRNQRYTDPTLDVTPWAVAAAGQTAFLRQATERLFDHGRAEYIESVHLLKTLLAVEQELSDGDVPATAGRLRAALNRFLHSPLKRKHVRRAARQALAFVAGDGG